MSNPIPFVDLSRAHEGLNEELLQAFSFALSESSFIMGEPLTLFEEAFASYCGSERCVGCSSGTTALHLALIGAGVEPGDEVITVAHTFIATAEAIMHCGAVPVFVDVDPVTYTMDSAAFEAAITVKTRAVIPVHLYGQLADMDAICGIAARHDLMVIEDAAQAHGARDEKGRRAGSIGQSGCFSFYPGKNLGGLGDSGAVTTSDQAIADRMRMLANHGRSGKYLHEYVGYNYRMDALQAAFLKIKLGALDAWLDDRKKLAAGYDEMLSATRLKLPERVRDHVYHLYVVESDNRDGLMAHLKSVEIASGVHYPIPLHKQPCFSGGGQDLPVTEAICERILSLPLFPGMTTEEQLRVLEAIRVFEESPHA